MINLWTSRERLLASYRREGALEIRDLGKAEYTAFVRDRAVLEDERGVLRIEEDFPGWYRGVWADYEARKASLERLGGVLYEADVSPARRFLADHPCKIDAPRRCYLDIETDSRVPVREQVETARGRILSWAVADEEGNKRVEVLSDDDDDAEAEFLAALWSWLSDYDQVAAWNGDGFDFPVIELRTQYLAGRRKQLFRHYWDHKRRLLFVDHLACFKRHHMAPESGDDKTSMKLNDVCEAILGDGKHDFDARRTWEAWAAGGEERARMAAYNLQDTELLPKLEAATGYLGLQQTLAEVTLTPANSHGLKPMAQVDGYMMRRAHVLGTHLPSKKPVPDHVEQYEGAFVLKPTKIGVHENVHVCDFKSLYPTVIRSFNIGYETKGVPGATAFGTGVLFGQEQESMLAGACREFMEQRDAWKKKAKADPNDKYAERMNKAFKIANNSIYGVMGSPWSRYYDVQIAESITLGAKHLALETRRFAEEQKLEVIYMDTDSLFVLGCTVDEFKTFVHRCNTELYPKLFADAGADPRWMCVELDYEKCFSRLVFPLGDTGEPVAKRYAGAYLHKGGNYNVEKPEIRGLEYMRGDGIRLGRHFQREAITRILRGDTSAQLEDWVQRERDRIMNTKLPLEDIVIQKGLGQELATYKTNTPHVRIARELEAAGEDVGAGTRIPYVIVDGTVSPKQVIHADKYDGTFDRFFVWNDLVWPATMRLLAGGFTDRNWKRWIARRPKRPLPGQTSLFG